MAEEWLDPVFVGVKMTSTMKKQLEAVAKEQHTDVSKIIREAIRGHLSGPSMLGFQRIILSTLFQSLENNLTLILIMLDKMIKDAEGEELEYLTQNRVNANDQLVMVREVMDLISKDDWSKLDKVLKMMGGGKSVITVQDLMGDLEK